VNSLLLLFVVLLLLKLVAGLVLDCINLRHVAARRESVPEAFREIVDEATYRKSVDYTVAKTRFGMLEEGVEALVLAAVILTGFLPWLYQSLSGLLGYGLWGQALTLFAVVVILGLPQLPFDWWSTFRLEERFGFNKSTPGLWVTDKLKGLAIGLVLGLPLIAVLLLFFQRFPASWWLLGFAAFFLFQLVMVVAYPMFILPLFNKLEPMEDGVLKSRLFALADRAGFKARTILVMDGSKRSSHSNAFFAGFGRFRRIVLFDTLIEQMQPEELEAVLAHEIGHYKLGHIPKRIVLSGLMTLTLFALLGWLAGAAWFPQGFGFETAPSESVVPVLLLFSLLAGLVTFWLTPLAASWSRQHEYEADAFAREAVDSPDPLIHALRKLHKENLSNLTPHPLYSAFHYSHPTLVEREAALRDGAGTTA
jgi:STE24 endopeptidase